MSGTKKKEEEVVTTTPPMDYQQFANVGTGTASQNYNAGNAYAEGVRNSAYQSAEAATAEANRLADNMYQRSVVDSRSSYQKAIGAYGSNAEALASRGLSGSGYGEWLQGNAYATHRGEVQAAGAQRLAAQKEAAYREQQAKGAADATYGQYLYQNSVNFNNEQNDTYTSLYNSAASGASIDSIMQDGRWGDLTPEQQQAITDKATAYSNDKTKAEVKDAQGQLASYLDLAAKGAYTIEALEAIAKSMGHYDALSAKGEDGTSLWDQVVSKAQSITNKQTVQDMIDNGATKEEIVASDAYNNLPEADKGTVDSAITERDESTKTEEENKQIAIDAAIVTAIQTGYTSAKALEDDLVGERVPESERAEIIAGWQKRNADDLIDMLGNASLGNTPKIGDEPIDLTGILNDVNNNMYGDRTPEVMNNLVKLIARCGIRDGAKEADVKVMKQVLSQIEKFWSAYKYPDKGETNSKIKKAYAIMDEYLTKLNGPPASASTPQGNSGATR
jgi:hypothetical protein